MLRHALVPRLISFRSDDAGAVTTDWVFLTAAVMGLCLAVLGTVGPGTRATADGTVDRMHTAPIEMSWNAGS